MSRKDKKADKFLACPMENDVFQWYFVIWDLKDTPFEGGIYLGKIELPETYPFKPPKIKMLTPNGRFKANQWICFSMSHFHPESWNPAWNVQSVIVGLISFMLTEQATFGYVATTDAEK